MFKILGSDGTEYGPVTADQLRQWIREGRAGGQTQVKPEGAGGWMPLNSVPEFADVFRAPPMIGSSQPGSMPPVVKVIAFVMLTVAVVSLLRFLIFYLPYLLRPESRISSSSVITYLSWSMGIMSVPFRIASGIGLLCRKEWARRLAIGLSIILALFGAWGLVQLGMWVGKMNDTQFFFRSPMFLIQQLWSVAVFLFNIATVVILTRKPVRDAFAKKSSAAV